MTDAPEYAFTSTWEVEASADEVFAILEDARALPRWWPSVYLDVTEVDAGGADGVGRVHSFFTKGWAPYTLRWSARTTRVDRPKVLELEAFGDLEGHGVWTLEEHGATCSIRYDWTVRAEKAFLKTFSFVLRPAFEANHRWAMARGEASLKLELQRRRATSEDERQAIPAPPPPTPRTPLPMILGAVGTVSAIAGAAVLWRRRR